MVIGYSMGGLIARYALAYMEEQGIAHETRLYVSYDAPQKGVTAKGLETLNKDHSAYFNLRRYF